MTGQHVANQCKLIFSEYGWFETLSSDNGPCYTAETFTSVMNGIHVNHITSSPYYPQSSGLAEKYVQIVKSLFHKAKEEGKTSIQMLHDLLQYTSYWQVAVTDANLAEQMCKI